MLAWDGAGAARGGGQGPEGTAPFTVLKYRKDIQYPERFTRNLQAIRARKCARAHTHTHTHTRAHAPVRARGARAPTHAHMQTHTHARGLTRTHMFGHARPRTDTHTCRHRSTHTHARTYSDAHACRHRRARTRARAHACCAHACSTTAALAALLVLHTMWYSADTSAVGALARTRRFPRAGPCDNDGRRAGCTRWHQRRRLRLCRGWAGAQPLPARVYLAPSRAVPTGTGEYGRGVFAAGGRLD